jgi:hypothetical protein
MNNLRSAIKWVRHSTQKIDIEEVETGLVDKKVIMSMFIIIFY